jgi:hypothetical protein
MPWRVAASSTSWEKNYGEVVLEGARFSRLTRHFISCSRRI